jgi:hypothetical protein
VRLRRIGAPFRPKRPTGGRPARRSSNQGLKVAAAVVVPLLVAIALIGLVGAHHGGGETSASSSSTTTVTASKAAKAFQSKVDDAFRPLGDAVKTFLPRAQDFEAGKVAPADFAGDVNAALPELVKARDAVGKLEKYRPDPSVNRYFFAAAELYVESTRVYAVATDPAAEALRSQLNLSARRLRTLGDRIYDRGRVVIDPTFYGSRGSDVDIRPPTEVPDWVAEGMAAGPPLAAAPGPAATNPPVREPTCAKGVAPPCRKEESEKEWAGRVRQAGLPQPADVASALDAADSTRLGELAATYETKTRSLWSAPDPKGQRERAAVLALGLLTDGEAARLGQAAALLPAGDGRTRLQAVARRVVVVADDLLDPGLGFRRSGLPASLLEDAGL